MTEITDLSPTDSSNTSISGFSTDGAIANMSTMDNVIQATLGMIGRWTASDTIASASTTDIGAQAEAYLTVSGTTTITSFGTIRAGTIRFLRFSGILTLTYNATSLKLPTAANITTEAGDTAIFVSEGSGNWACLSYSRASGQGVGTTPLKGYINGLTLSNNTTDPTNDIDIAIGSAVDSTGVVSMVLSVALGKQLDVAWAVGGTPGSPAGGRMSAAAIANTTYHVFLIRRPDTGVVDVGFDVSATAPTLPTNYTQFRRIGSILREGGAIVLGNWNGDRFVRSVPAVNVNTTGTTFNTPTLSSPQGIVVTAFGTASISTTLTSAARVMLITALYQADTAPSLTLNDVFVSTQAEAGTYAGWGSWNTDTDTSRQIRYRVNAGEAATTVTIVTYGWYDRRGQ